MTTEQATVKQVLSTGQVTFLFLIFVSMLFVIFTVGMYIGRWSQPTLDRKSESLRTANISFVEPGATSATTTGSNQSDAAHQPLPGSPLSISIDESKMTPGYVVQVATLSTQAEAEGLLTQLKRDGLTKGYVRAPEPGSVVQSYSVEVATFDDKATAEQFAGQLKTKGLTRSRVIQVYTEKKLSKPADQNVQSAPATP
jgi:cell division septation protein DedD